MGKKNKEYAIHCVVAVKKKEAKIMQGGVLLKTYRFKMDVPFTIEKRTFHGYDYSAWSVSDRYFSYERDVKVYDERVIEGIRQKAMEEYQKSSNPSHIQSETEVSEG